MCWRWTASTSDCCICSKHGFARLGVLVAAGLGRQISKTMLIKSAAGLDAAWCGAGPRGIARAVVVEVHSHLDHRNCGCSGCKGCNQVIWLISGIGVTFSPSENSICARSSTDRASDYGSEGWGFESLRAHKGKPQ